VKRGTAALNKDSSTADAGTVHETVRSFLVANDELKVGVPGALPHCLPVLGAVFGAGLHTSSLPSLSFTVSCRAQVSAYFGV
jgi:hypothetical protein